MEYNSYFNSYRSYSAEILTELFSNPVHTVIPLSYTFKLFIFDEKYF